MTVAVLARCIGRRLHDQSLSKASTSLCSKLQTLFESQTAISNLDDCLLKQKSICLK